MIGKKEEISNKNVHQMYTMCMMIENKRLINDREFDMVSKLRSDKEGDDYNVTTRMTEASVNYQNSLFNGQGSDLIDDKQQVRICGPMENVTFHIRETNKMDLILGSDTDLFKQNDPTYVVQDTTGNLQNNGLVEDEKPVDTVTEKKDDT